MANTKDTIYLDIDDEITTIIDKVESSSADLVVLVLPKRAAVLQSSVNIKLLKRSVDAAEKSLVLITSDASVISLAADNKMYVSADLTSKPEIPVNADGVNSSPSKFINSNKEEIINLSQDELVDLPISQLDKAAASIPIEDNSEDNKSEVNEAVPPKKPKHKKDKSLFIPNFHKFRAWFFLVILFIILLIVGIYYGLVVMPKAVIDIKTNASNVSINVPLNLSTTATSANLTSGTIPAKLINYSKTYTSTVPTTGQSYPGPPASGTVSLELNNCSNSIVYIPSGAGISAGSNLTYITQSSVTLNSDESNNICYSPNSHYAQTVNVIAVSNGASYNLASGTNMQVAPFTYQGVSYTTTDFTATSGAITGGSTTSNQVATQTDIDNATAQLNTTNSGAQNALTQQVIQAGLYPLSATLTTSQPTVTDSAAVGATATSETVSETIVYSMYGVAKTDLENILNNSIVSQVSSANQTIINNGFNSLNMTLNNSSSTNLTMTTTAEIGPNISVANIKKSAVGKKTGDIVAQLKSNPNITSVKVNLTPFWVSTVPSNLSKITVNVAKP